MSRRTAMIQAMLEANLQVSYLGRDRLMEHYTAAVDKWIEQGLIQSESFEEEAERLRARVHEVVDECQERFAPYVSRCEKFDTWSAWAKDHFEQAGDSTWTQGSEANRLLILSLMEERDEARELARMLQIDKYTEMLEWLCEDDHFALMLEYSPELMQRLQDTLSRGSE